jgi:hypothetical protein
MLEKVGAFLKIEELVPAKYWLRTAIQQNVTYQSK